MVFKKHLFAVLIAGLSFGFVGDSAKNFKLVNLQNKQVELKKLLEKGPVLVDFWATWCKPCIKAFPELEALYQKYKDKGVTVVGINTDGPRNQAKVKPFVNSLNISFPILIDLNGDVMRQYRVMVLPTSFLIAPDGKILETNIGYVPQKMRKIDEMIGKMVAEKNVKE